MADLEYIARKALAARQFEQVAGPVTFSMQLPTKLESSIAYAQSLVASGRRDAVANLRFQRALVLQAVVGWRGVLVQHVLPRHPDPAEVFEFEPGAAEVLLDAQPEWETELLQALLGRVAAREAAEDSAEKN
jgi:hypothetical protein